MPNIEVISASLSDLHVKHLAEASRAAPDDTEVEWMSPLEVLFSQNVVYPKFTDGRSVDEAVKLIKGVPRSNTDGLTGTSDAEVLLEAPFPGIQAIRWCPKLRDGQGKPLPDGEGGFRMGAEGLFTVDNRRLYAFQRAAVAQWPRKCTIPVEVITNRIETMKHLKKFRTRTNGLSITVSEWNGVGRDNIKDFSAMRVWDWRSALSSVQAGGAGLQAALQAADTGSCGCWEYIDNEKVTRGPFSNWQMQQWWQRKMLPADLQVRPYDAAATVAKTREPPAYRTIVDYFAEAPEPFAPGWSPQTTEQEGEWNKCMQCNRKRWEGWEAHGQWYCSMCWKRWQKNEDPSQRGASSTS